jgi:CubicO group peptidase (beta-lactamase class C family)
MSSARLKRISTYLQTEIEKHQTPGAALLVARNGSILYEDAFGYQDRVKKTPMRKDTIFRIYSMTKPIVSVAIMMLVEEARILLSDPIEKYIPSFKSVKVAVVNEDDTEILDLVPPKRSITIQDLLRHTSGLTYGIFGRPTAVRKAYLKRRLGQSSTDLETFVDELSKLPLIAHPGERWEYGHSTEVLGRLIEVVTGEKLSTFLKTRIFVPLQMKDTGFFIPAGQLSRAAQGFDAETGSYPAYLTDVAKPPRRESGGGGLVSTMYDYVRFCQFILNRGELDGVRLLGSRTVDLMAADHLKPNVDPGDLFLPGPGNGFGLGFAVRLDKGISHVLGSKGELRWGGWAGTAFWIDPEEDLTCILMIQDVPLRNYYRWRFKNLVYQSIID